MLSYSGNLAFQVLVVLVTLRFLQRDFCLFVFKFYPVFLYACLSLPEVMSVLFLFLSK